MSNILVFGASGTFGAWDLEGGWVQRLRSFSDKKSITDLDNFILIYNLGVSGDTTEDILKRIEAETEVRLSRSGMSFIFSVVTNDSRLINKKPAVEPEKFKENVQKLITFAKKYTSKIVFIGPQPIYPDFVEWSETETYNIEDIKKYRDIVKTVCKENEIHYIEILEELMKLDYKKLFEDELHLNSEGHQKIFEIVKDFLVENKII